MNIPREEYPRPQMVRDAWKNLNGSWEFEFDFGQSGKERGILHRSKFSKEILVPFCPESELSGINYKDFINACWYRRKFTIPNEWKDGRILLNFEAVDYLSEIWINGNPAGSHKGGYTPFSIDITEHLIDGENTITVYVVDDVRSEMQPRGKQCEHYNSTGCDYTRVTGIWQTVWLECVPAVFIKTYKCIPDVDNCRVHLDVSVDGTICEKSINAIATYNGKIVGEAHINTTSNESKLTMDLSELHLWQPRDAKLYDLDIILDTGGQRDIIKGYFGMRKLELSDNALLVNGKPVFQRLVLDQGYYPDGIYTAPCEGALKKDIELSLALGFNGARLHQKVFERRFIHLADRMGYLVWGEYGNWGLNHSKAEALTEFLPQWLEVIERDFNSPALIGWCPFNETWDVEGHKQNDDVLRCVYLATKAIDRSRPVIDTSGNYHVVTDIFDVHDYTQQIETFAEHYKLMAEGGEAYNTFPARQAYGGQPYFVSEYGGIWWKPGDKNGWGYGKRPESEAEFVERYIGLANVLLSNPRICGLCYTQLYDIEQEVNGLYYYDRTPKFNAEIMKKLREVMEQKAAIEK